MTKSNSMCNLNLLNSFNGNYSIANVDLLSNHSLYGSFNLNSKNSLPSNLNPLNLEILDRSNKQNNELGSLADLTKNLSNNKINNILDDYPLS